MANFHLEVKTISRGQLRSVTKAANYIYGKKLRDYHYDKTYYRRRLDILHKEIILPANAPPDFYNLQTLCLEIDKAEKRYDAQTAREFKGSLGNELPLSELVEIVREYVGDNFIVHGYCAIVAIHAGENKISPAKNNPHLHAIIPFRTLAPGGFSQTKTASREFNTNKALIEWRREWAEVQNRAYERNGFKNIRVSHESYEVQGEKREPGQYLTRIDWEREQRDERTARGDINRAIQTRNKARDDHRQREYQRELELEQNYELER
jgi:hypothetical protein